MWPCPASARLALPALGHPVIGGETALHHRPVAGLALLLLLIALGAAIPVAWPGWPSAAMAPRFRLIVRT